MSWNWLIGYKQKERIPSQEDFEEMKSMISSFEDIRTLLQSSPFKELGISEELLCHELVELIRQRLLSAFIPEKAIEPPKDKEIKPYIREHLHKLGISSDESLVGALFFLSNNIIKAKDEYSPAKFGITNVYTSYRCIYDEILKRQNNRCACCGCELEYGRNMQLDHILPAHLGDDAYKGSNWQFLCDECNRGKNEYLHYTSRFYQVACITAGFKNQLTEALRYATLERNHKCYQCGKTSRETQLYVVKKFDTGVWVLDNTICLCEPCMHVRQA